MIEIENKITKILNFNIVPYKEEYLIFVLCLLNDDKPMLLYAKTKQPHFELSQVTEDEFFYYTVPHLGHQLEIKLNCPLFGETQFTLISLDEISKNKQVSKAALEKIIGCDIV